MKKMQYLLLVLILCFHPISLVAAETAEAQIRALLELSGLDKLTDHIPEFAHGSLVQGRGSIEPKIYKLIEDIIPRAYAPKYLNEDLQKELARGFDNKRAADYLAFLRSPLAKEFSDAEGQKPNHPEYQSFVKTMGQGFALSKRGKLITRLDKATRSSLFAIEMQTSFFRSIFRTVDPFLEADMRLGAGELSKMTKEVQQSLTAPSENMTLYAYAFAFRKFSDKILEEYVTAYESPSAMWGAKLLSEALIRTLETAGDRMVAIAKQAGPIH